MANTLLLFDQPPKRFKVEARSRTAFGKKKKQVTCDPDEEGETAKKQQWIRLWRLVSRTRSCGVAGSCHRPKYSSTPQSRGYQLLCAWLLLRNQLGICNSWHSGKVPCVGSCSVRVRFSVGLKGNGDWALPTPRTQWVRFKISQWQSSLEKKWKAGNRMKLFSLTALIPYEKHIRSIFQPA